MVRQRFWATPKCLLFDVHCSRTHLVPVPIQTSRTSYISPQDLDVFHWLLTEIETDDWGVNPLLSEALRPFSNGSLAGSGPTFVAYYTPQRFPFRPDNRCLRILSAQALRHWYGDILVAKVDTVGHIVDVEEQDVGLIEHLVLMWVPGSNKRFPKLTPHHSAIVRRNFRSPLSSEWL